MCVMGDGEILEELDAMGQVSSYLRTADSRVTSLPYASLEGASFQKGEALYYGGEDYEDRTNWHISGLSVEKNSRLNEGSYLWSNTGGSLTYVQGLQIRAGENYTAYLRVYGGGSGSQVLLTFKGKTVSKRLQPGWQVVQFDIANADITGASGLMVSLGALTGLDYVMLRPQSAHMSVDVYDAKKNVVMSHEDILTTIYIRNPISESVLTHYASTSLGITPYYSGGKTSGLNASFPGQDLTLLNKTYADGPSCHMSIDFAGDEFVALKTGDVSSIPLESNWKSYALVFDLDIKPDQSITINRGDVTLTFLNQITDGHLEVTVVLRNKGVLKSSSTVSYDTASSLFPLRHIVVFHPYQVSWFMGGSSLFSYKSDDPISWGGSNLKIYSMSGAVLSPIVVGEDPLLSCQFIDEQGRVLQSQEWTYMNNEEPYLSTVCRQNFYDNNGAFLAKSLPVPYDSSRLGVYQKTLATFSMHDSVNVGEMSGDVLTYWRERDVQNAPYAYESVSRETTPGGAIVASCAPGLYERNYVAVSGGVSHNATFIERQVTLPPLYGVASADVGYFMREQLSKPRVGAITGNTTSVKDTFGRVVGTVLEDGSKMSTQYHYGQEGTVRSQTGQSPLSYVASDPTQYASTSKTWDSLGLHHTLSFPDTGETEHITNLRGQMVFSRDAEGSSGTDPVVRYCVYDDAGRLIEKGLLQMAWDTDTLISCALSGTLPSGVSSLWKTKKVYDSRGRMIQDQYNNSDDSVGVVMVRDYTYNLQGSVTSVKESRWDGGLSGTQKYVYTTRYNYDTLGVRLESVVYPDGQTLYLIYDAKGRLYCKSSESDGGGTVYLRIKRYTENGQVHCYTTGNDRYTTLLIYDIQGRLIKEEVWADNQEVFGESLAYGYGEKFDVGGSISEKESGGSAISQPERYTYRYDRAGQLAEVYSVTDNKPYLEAGSSRKYRVLLNDGVLDCDTSSGEAICRSMSTSSPTNVVSVEVDSEGQYFQMRNATFSQGGGYLGFDSRGKSDLVWDASSENAHRWHNWSLSDLGFGWGLSNILRSSEAYHIIPGQQGSAKMFLDYGSTPYLQFGVGSCG